MQGPPGTISTNSNKQYRNRGVGGSDVAACRVTCRSRAQLSREHHKTSAATKRAQQSGLSAGRSSSWVPQHVGAGTLAGSLGHVSRQFVPPEGHVSGSPPPPAILADSCRHRWVEKFRNPIPNINSTRAHLETFEVQKAPSSLRLLSTVSSALHPRAFRDWAQAESFRVF